jgi:DNA-binding winged helix-turn-helix (wHTH) protein
MRVSFADCVVDLERRQLFRRDRDVHVTPKAFDLLALLLGERPRAIAKTEIHDRLWPGTFVTESNLTTLVTELRAALGDSARSPRYVKTVPRFGYAFCASATEVVEPPPGRRRRVRHFTLSWADGQVALHDGENVIGREEDATAWIESASVSRRHARIVISEGTATLEDLGSKNGTTYRGQRITSPVVLTSDEVIVVGLVPLRFRSSQGAPSTRTVAKR